MCIIAFNGFSSRWENLISLLDRSFQKYNADCAGVALTHSDSLFPHVTKVTIDMQSSIALADHLKKQFPRGLPRKCFSTIARGVQWERDTRVNEVEPIIVSKDQSVYLAYSSKMTMIGNLSGKKNKSEVLLRKEGQEIANSIEEQFVSEVIFDAAVNAALLNFDGSYSVAVSTTKPQYLDQIVIATSGESFFEFAVKVSQNEGDSYTVVSTDRNHLPDNLNLDFERLDGRSMMLLEPHKFPQIREIR